ncbi:hypothetical protein GQ53DRAFT_15923 [Thozetella sp. PMI_491]|nr:hypothetical protein GQ53DRAFT_15923 [Thozetella sp. PMI_491]
MCSRETRRGSELVARLRQAGSITTALDPGGPLQPWPCLVHIRAPGLAAPSCRGIDGPRRRKGKRATRGGKVGLDRDQVWKGGAGSASFEKKTGTRLPFTHWPTAPGKTRVFGSSHHSSPGPKANADVITSPSRRPVPSLACAEWVGDRLGRGRPSGRGRGDGREKAHRLGLIESPAGCQRFLRCMPAWPHVSACLSNWPVRRACTCMLIIASASPSTCSSCLVPRSPPAKRLARSRGLPTCFPAYRMHRLAAQSAPAYLVVSRLCRHRFALTAVALLPPHPWPRARPKSHCHRKRGAHLKPELQIYSSTHRLGAISHLFRRVYCRLPDAPRSHAATPFIALSRHWPTKCYCILGTNLLSLKPPHTTLPKPASPPPSPSPSGPLYTYIRVRSCQSQLLCDQDKTTQ